MQSVQNSMFDSYLDEFMSRKIYGKEPITAFNNLDLKLLITYHHHRKLTAKLIE